MAGAFHALLIGVNCYLPNKLPGGGSYRNLSGCVRDIDRVDAYLRSAFQLPPTAITRLTSTTGPNGQPSEPAGQLPSYEHMVNALKALAAKAQPGDQVYFHYSGHGGRTTTAFPELKEAAGLDEALVPYDIGNSEARYLRDVELGALFKAIADTGAVLTVVLDSCHSGGATRGEEEGVSTAVARGMDPGETINKEGLAFDPTERPTDSLVASHEELVAAAGGPGQRGVNPGSGWLQTSQNFTLIAACRANESAYEDTFEGQRNGALTYWLLRSLPLLPPRANYQVLHNILLARIRSWMGAQTPQLQGEGNRLVFGSEHTTGPSGILVAKVESPGSFLLNAGEAHGLRPGALLAVYPNGATDLTAEGGRLAVVKVTELVGDADSRAALVTDHERGAIEPGAQAVVIGVADQQSQRAVAFGKTVPAELTAALQASLAADGAGFLRLANAGESADFQIGVTDGAYVVLNRSGEPIPNLKPPLLTTEPDAAERLIKRLVHLAKYENVRAIQNADPSMASRVQVWLESGAAGAPAAVDDGRAPVFPPGVPVTLRIKNLLTKNPNNRNDPSRILNVTVLHLANDYSIQQVFPHPQEGAFAILQPEDEFHPPLTFETDLPEGLDEVTDILKVFVTQKTTDFRSLLLEELDSPSREQTRSIAEMDDPLDVFLASFAGNQAADEEALQTRLALVTAPKQPRPWTTSQVEIVVKKA